MNMELRNLPSVDRILTDKRIARIAKKYPHDLLVRVIREQLEQERISITDGKSSASLDGIVNAVLDRLDAVLKPSLRHVVNASGRLVVILCGGSSPDTADYTIPAIIKILANAS